MLAGVRERKAEEYNELASTRGGGSTRVRSEYIEDVDREGVGDGERPGERHGWLGGKRGQEGRLYIYTGYTYLLRRRCDGSFR